MLILAIQGHIRRFQPSDCPRSPAHQLLSATFLLVLIICAETYVFQNQILKVSILSIFHYRLSASQCLRSSFFGFYS
jgi:hypothetical protein